MCFFFQVDENKERYVNILKKKKKKKEFAALDNSVFFYKLCWGNNVILSFNNAKLKSLK